MKTMETLSKNSQCLVCCHYIGQNIEEIRERGGGGREGKEGRKVKEDEKDKNAKRRLRSSKRKKIREEKEEYRQGAGKGEERKREWKKEEKEQKKGLIKGNTEEKNDKKKGAITMKKRWLLPDAAGLKKARCKTVTQNNTPPPPQFFSDTILWPQLKKYVGLFLRQDKRRVEFTLLCRNTS
jgi:hypothetical protein